VYRMMMRAKIHRATVTEANLNYVGSITVDEDILDAVGIFPHEQVQIVDNNNGARFETYAIAGPRGSGMICLNGAAARLVQPGDIIIIMAYSMMTDDAARVLEPRIAILGEENRVLEMLFKEKPTTMLE
jgi:aspartate 1-decarboxylase